MSRVPLTEHDQYFCCDDIEIWEVKKETSTDFDDMVTWPVTDSRGGISLQNWGDSQPVIHAHCVVHCDIVTSRLLTIHQRGCRIENSLSDSESGGVIGTSLWASSVVVSR